MRRGFTMIELIFVLIILGILATVALPKLTNTATDAKITTAESFIATLNRTVGPSMWAHSVKDGNGSIKDMKISSYTHFPTDFILNKNGTKELGNCTLKPTVKIGSITIGDKIENIYCQDGTNTKVPQFGFDSNLSTKVQQSYN